LFLGVYKPNPKDHRTIWDADERELHEIGSIPDLVPRWWEQNLRGFEAQMPRQLMRDLRPVFNPLYVPEPTMLQLTVVPDENRLDEILHQFI
jgi:hypothetical protein